MRRIFAAILITLVFAPALTLTGIAQQTSPRKGTKVPVVRQIDVEGLKAVLALGKARERPLLVNFWATWCVPCREEFPDLIQASRQHDPSKLEFVTVSLDDVAEMKTSVPKFLKQMGAQMASYLLNATEPEEAIKTISDTWSGELPATFLIDREGRVVFEHKGRITFAELSAALRTLIK